MFGDEYFASSNVVILAEWKIGVPHLAAGLAATAMKFECEEFCSQIEPQGLMIPQNEKE